MATQRFDLDGNDVGPEEDEEIVSTPEEEAHLRELELMAPFVDAAIAHIARVQQTFPLVTDVRDGAPVLVCRACGVPALDHDLEVCRGGARENRRSARRGKVTS